MGGRQNDAVLEGPAAPARRRPAQPPADLARPAAACPIPAAAADPGAPRPALASLTSLRFVAALMVFLVHGVLLLPDPSLTRRIVFAGPTGVGFFFVLSGFVLTWSRHPTDSSSHFYRRRFARIYPNHVLVWAGWIATYLVIGYSVSAGASSAILLLVQSWVPGRAFVAGMDTPSWSLACEAFFYLLFPILIVALTRLSSRGRRVAMAVAAGAPFLLVGVNAVAARHLPADASVFFVYNFPLARLPEFLLGVLLALEIRAGRWPRIPLAPAFGATIAALALVDVIGQPRWWVAIPAIPFGVLIGSLAMHDQAGRPTVLHARGFVRLGHWSYAFYLLHGLVLTLLVEWHPHRFAPTESTVALLAALAVSTILSGVVFAGVERPCERWLRSRPEPPPVAEPVAAAALA